MAKAAKKRSASDMTASIAAWCESLSALPLPEQVEALNQARRLMHEAGQFKREPVDLSNTDGRIEIAGDTLPNRYVPPDVASKFLGLSLATLASWRSLGVGPVFTKLSAGKSGAVRYSLLELERFAADPIGYRPRAKAPFRKPNSHVDEVTA